MPLFTDTEMPVGVPLTTLINLQDMILGPKEREERIIESIKKRNEEVMYLRSHGLKRRSAIDYEVAKHVEWLTEYLKRYDFETLSERYDEV